MKRFNLGIEEFGELGIEELCSLIDPIVTGPSIADIGEKGLWLSERSEFHRSRR